VGCLVGNGPRSGVGMDVGSEGHNQGFAASSLFAESQYSCATVRALLYASASLFEFQASSKPGIKHISNSQDLTNDGIKQGASHSAHT